MGRHQPQKPLGHGSPHQRANISSETLHQPATLGSRFTHQQNSTSYRKPCTQQPAMSGTSHAHQQDENTSGKIGSATTHPQNMALPSSGPAVAVGHSGFYSQLPGKLALPISSWQFPYKAGPGKQPDWGSAMPSSLPLLVNPQQQKDPCSPHRARVFNASDKRRVCCWDV